MADYYEMVSQVNQNISRGSFCLGAKYFLTLHAPEEKKWIFSENGATFKYIIIFFICFAKYF